MKVEYQVVSIEAWREPDGGWFWNAAYNLPVKPSFDPDEMTPRKLLRLLREEDVLSNWSKGRVRVVEFGECDFEVQDKGTREPLIAVQRTWAEEKEESK